MEKYIDLKDVYELLISVKKKIDNKFGLTKSYPSNNYNHDNQYLDNICLFEMLLNIRKYIDNLAGTTLSSYPKNTQSTSDGFVTSIGLNLMLSKLKTYLGTIKSTFKTYQGVFVESYSLDLLINTYVQNPNNNINLYKSLSNNKYYTDKNLTKLATCLALYDVSQATTNGFDGIIDYYNSGELIGTLKISNLYLDTENSKIYIDGIIVSNGKNYHNVGLWSKDYGVFTNDIISNPTNYDLYETD